ncbi:hypothetical protein ENKNEFLB_02536 [Nocardioides aquaticus]|jgi:hypothetical protein|uniref:Uncharacterized protein n=1 Tax=Nocardioides aquaticus TaxID=160826 RepID=A0ABX8EI00_9ACTN|nr:hypothetical protein ENKNEFLB_02536 [Nocardioides aquaticus]
MRGTSVKIVLAAALAAVVLFGGGIVAGTTVGSSSTWETFHGTVGRVNAQGTAIILDDVTGLDADSLDAGSLAAALVDPAGKATVSEQVEALYDTEHDIVYLPA